MVGQTYKTARAIATDVLNQCDPKKNYAGAILDSMRHETDQSQRATDLVFGTLRNRKAIDAVITKFSSRSVKRIQGWLLNIIRIGTYELIYCPSTEQHAIVNEAVSSAKSAGSDKQAGFVNAILRQVTRHISNRQIALTEDDTRRTLPQSFATCCQFDTSFLPDRQINPAEYLSTVFSLPEWLVAGWIDEFGEEATRRICFASNRRPSVYIRPNILKTTTEALTEKLTALEVGFEIVLPVAPKGVPEGGPPYGGDAEMIRIISPRDVTQLPGFTEGLFTVQDIAASKSIKTLKNLKLKTTNLKFLDLCAAPGTKTTQLAEATGDTAEIIATDIDNKRLDMVKENITRLGIKSVVVVPYDQLLNSQFDCVLLDVPCSNTGVLARRVEARYRINQTAIKRLSDIQSGLLETAVGMLKPAGLICYSTCSIQKTENSKQIEDFLKKNKNFSLGSEQLTLPLAEGFDHDGGYAAILDKQERK